MPTLWLSQDSATCTAAWNSKYTMRRWGSKTGNNTSQTELLNRTIYCLFSPANSSLLIMFFELITPEFFWLDYEVTNLKVFSLLFFQVSDSETWNLETGNDFSFNIFGTGIFYTSSTKIQPTTHKYVRMYVCM